MTNQEQYELICEKSKKYDNIKSQMNQLPCYKVNFENYTDMMLTDKAFEILYDGWKDYILHPYKYPYITMNLSMILGNNNLEFVLFHDKRVICTLEEKSILKAR